MPNKTFTNYQKEMRFTLDLISLIPFCIIYDTHIRSYDEDKILMAESFEHENCRNH